MALATRDRQRLRKILDLSDRLGRLRRRVREGPEPISRKDFTAELRAIAGSVVSIGLPGTLGRLQTEHRLSPQEVMALLMLLGRRLEPGTHFLTGREILATLFPSAYGILSGISILAADAPLRVSGVMEVAAPEGNDLLETGFAIADAVFRAVERDVNPRAAPEPEALPYRNHWEHLADLGRLSTLLLRRACALFEGDPYGVRFFENQEPVPVLDRRASALAASIRDRLAATPRAEAFPLLAISRRLRLTADEQLILAALLFQECYYGSRGLDPVDCVKMVSRTPEEVLRKRALLAREGALRSNGLVEDPDPVDEGESGADLVLPLWVASLLLGEKPAAGTRPIGPDTRIEFHEYLKRLGDSDQFYRDLDWGQA